MAVNVLQLHAPMLNEGFMVRYYDLSIISLRHLSHPIKCNPVHKEPDLNKNLLLQLLKLTRNYNLSSRNLSKKFSIVIFFYFLASIMKWCIGDETFIAVYWLEGVDSLCPPLIWCLRYLALYFHSVSSMLSVIIIGNAVGSVPWGRYICVCVGADGVILQSAALGTSTLWRCF